MRIAPKHHKQKAKLANHYGAVTSAVATANITTFSWSLVLELEMQLKGSALNTIHFSVISDSCNYTQANLQWKVGSGLWSIHGNKMECDKQKCAGTGVHAGMRFFIQCRLLSQQSAFLVRPH